VVQGWFEKDLVWLKPSDWYSAGHTLGACVWTPPPAATDAALEQLGQAIHKSPYHSYVVIIPRQITSRWQKLLGKICDLIFTVPFGTNEWSHQQFEPLIVAIYFHSPGTNPGDSKEPRSWNEWRGLCVICCCLL
jgi:hypothetical protein